MKATMTPGLRPSTVDWAVTIPCPGELGGERGSSCLVFAFAQLLMDPGDLPHIIRELPLSDRLGDVVR